MVFLVMGMWETRYLYKSEICLIKAPNEKKAEANYIKRFPERRVGWIKPFKPFTDEVKADGYSQLQYTPTSI